MARPLSTNGRYRPGRHGLTRQNNQAANLCYMGQALMENRRGLAVGAMLTPATGSAQRQPSQ